MAGAFVPTALRTTTCPKSVSSGSVQFRVAARYAPVASNAVGWGGYQSIVLKNVRTGTSAVPSASCTPATEIWYGALSTSCAAGLMVAVSVAGSYATVAGIVAAVLPFRSRTVEPSTVDGSTGRANVTDGFAVSDALPDWSPGRTSRTGYASPAEVPPAPVS